VNNNVCVCGSTSHGHRVGNTRCIYSQCLCECVFNVMGTRNPVSEVETRVHSSFNLALHSKLVDFRVFCNLDTRPHSIWARFIKTRWFTQLALFNSSFTWVSENFTDTTNFALKKAVNHFKNTVSGHICALVAIFFDCPRVVRNKDQQKVVNLILVEAKNFRV
jgi:hypothetical protein